MPRKVITAAAPQPQQDTSIQVEVTLPLRQRGGEKITRHTAASRPGSPPRIPRIARLMALAVKFQDMVDRGEVRDYADLARLGYVSRARVTQIMNLLLLAPDIQALLLSAPPELEQITESRFRPLVACVYWPDQRAMWTGLISI